MEVDIDIAATLHSTSRGGAEDSRSDSDGSVSSHNENDRNLLQKIHDILKPLCDTVQLTLEKKICSFDKSEFLKIYNPLSDQYFKFFPNLHLIIHIAGGNLNIKLFFEHSRVVREAVLASLEEQLSNPEEYLGTVTVLSSFLSELCVRKYDVCHGAFDEETFLGDIAQVDVRRVLIENSDSRVVYRARQCHLLVSKGSTTCPPCQDLRNQQQTTITGDTIYHEELCDPLDMLEVNIEDEQTENKPNTEDLMTSPVLPSQCKPKISYKKLIMGAIEDSPDRRLKLNDIYEWILSRYPSFSNNRTGFQNSIRHNLSLNKVFIKVDAPNQGGKGGFWTINPKLESGLMKTFPVPDRSHKPTTVLKRLQPKGPMAIKDNPLSPLSVLEPRIVSCKSIFFNSRDGELEEVKEEVKEDGHSVLEPEVTITSIPANLSSLTGITVNIKNQSQRPDTSIHPPPVCKKENISVESVLQSLQPIPVAPQQTYHVNPQQYSKPTFSYKELIMISIFSDASQAMCLHDIYLTIQKWFPYFQQKEIGVTWQNSIRHNLSLNKCFQRLNTYLPTKVMAGLLG